MLRLVVLGALLLLAGCVTTGEKKEAFKNTNDSLIGRSADDLVIKKGPPSSSYTLSTGGKVFEYSNSETVTSGGNSYTFNKAVYQPGPNGGTWVYVPTQQTVPVSSSVKSCKLLFSISPENIVEKWTAEGNRCY